MADGEKALYPCRQHAIVLIRPIGIWVASLVAAFVLGVVFRGMGWFTGARLGGFLVLAATLYAGYEWWAWRVARYLITDKRAMLLEGIIARRISTIPFEKVTEIKYSRTVPGRILGYGVLLLDTPGETPGLDTLDWLPKPDVVYQLVASIVFKKKTEKPTLVHITSIDPAVYAAYRRQAGSPDDTGEIPAIRE